MAKNNYPTQRSGEVLVPITVIQSLRDAGVQQKTVAIELGISEATLSRKLHGQPKFLAFKTEHANKLYELLSRECHQLNESSPKLELRGVNPLSALSLEQISIKRSAMLEGSDEWIRQTDSYLLMLGAKGQPSEMFDGYWNLAQGNFANGDSEVAYLSARALHARVVSLRISDLKSSDIFELSRPQYQLASEVCGLPETDRLSKLLTRGDMLEKSIERLSVLNGAGHLALVMQLLISGELSNRSTDRQATLHAMIRLVTDLTAFAPQTAWNLLNPLQACAVRWGFPEMGTETSRIARSALRAQNGGSFGPSAMAEYAKSQRDGWGLEWRLRMVCDSMLQVQDNPKRAEQLIHAAEMRTPLCAEPFFARYLDAARDIIIHAQNSKTSSLPCVDPEFLQDSTHLLYCPFS